MFRRWFQNSRQGPERFNNTAYSVLNNAESDLESDENHQKNESIVNSGANFKSTARKQGLPWIFVIILCVSNAWTLLRKCPCPSVSDTDSNVSNTCNGLAVKSSDFAPAQDILSLQPVRFTSGIRHDSNGTLYRTNPEQKAYVGRPSPSIDVAWYELTKGLDLYVTPSEAQAIDADMYLFPETGMYQTEVEWLHNLHCLNYIRKSFDFEYYTADLHHPEESHVTHRDHCINALRQVLTCHGDMTPLPKMWDPETDREFTDFERIHMCRDVEVLRQWATERSYDQYERQFEADNR